MYHYRLSSNFIRRCHVNMIITVTDKQRDTQIQFYLLLQCVEFNHYLEFSNWTRFGLNDFPEFDAGKTQRVYKEPLYFSVHETEDERIYSAV